MGLEAFIYQLAGVVGVDPGRLTLRQLVWMAEGRRRDAWQHTSALLAMLFNAHRDPKKSQPRKPADFDPYSQHALDNVTSDIRALKSILPPAK